MSISLASQQTKRPAPGRTIERYILALAARPIFGTLLILLPALLLERLLRLFVLIANNSVPPGSVGRMLVDLSPYYLGQALPFALFIGIHAVVARLSAANELDAMQAAGLSLGRISRPFILIGLVATIIGFALYGYLQPLTRYAYRIALEAATEGLWNAIVPAGQMTRISDTLEVTADRTSRDGGLSHIFVYQREADGTELVSTGRAGTLALTAGGTALVLQLRDGERLEVEPDQSLETLTAPSTVMQRPYVLKIGQFEPRGLDERELTLGELWSARNQRQPPEPRRRLDGELHCRVIRALTLAVLPLLAVPVGLAAKRARRAQGIVIGVVIIVLYFHALQLAQSLGSAGLIDPRALLWAVFATFTCFCAYMFRRAIRFTNEGPLDRVLEGLNRGFDRVRRMVRA